METWDEIRGPERLELGAIRALRVSVVAGSVSVVGGDAPPVLEVTAVNGPPVRMRIEHGELRIEHKSAGPWLFGVGRRGWPTVDLSVAVPKDCPVRLDGVSASVVVSGIGAPVRVSGVSGEITLVGLAGPVETHTVSGPVEAQAIAGSLTANTVSGGVTLIEGAGGSLRAETVSGAVTCDLGEADPADLQLATVSGDVTVRLPAASDLVVRLSAGSGEVTTDFPELGRSYLPRRRKAEGVLGAGTGRLRASTATGQIALLRGEPRRGQDTAVGA